MHPTARWLPPTSSWWVLTPVALRLEGVSLQQVAFQMPQGLRVAAEGWPSLSPLLQWLSGLPPSVLPGAGHFQESESPQCSAPALTGSEQKLCFARLGSKVLVLPPYHGTRTLSSSHGGLVGLSVLTLQGEGLPFPSGCVSNGIFFRSVLEYFYFVFVVLGLEPRSLHMLGSALSVSHISSL